MIAGDGSSPEQAFAAAVKCHGLGPPGHVALALDAVGWSLPASGLPVAQLLMADGYLTSVRRIVDAPAPREPPMRLVLDGLRSRLAVISGQLRDPLVEPPHSPPAGSDPDAVGADGAGNGAIADPPRGLRGGPAPARRRGGRPGRGTTGVAGAGALRAGGAGLPAARGVVTHRAEPGGRGLAVEPAGRRRGPDQRLDHGLLPAGGGKSGARRGDPEPHRAGRRCRQPGAGRAPRRARFRPRSSGVVTSPPTT